MQELHCASPGDVIGFVRTAPLALHVLLGDDTSEIWKLHVIGVGYLMTIALGFGNAAALFNTFKEWSGALQVFFDRCLGLAV